LNSEAIQKYYANTPSAKWLVLVSICLTNFLNSVTNSSVNVATPSIASALQANAILVSWIPTSFLLSSVVMLLPAGRLADIHGRKKLCFCFRYPLIFLISLYLQFIQGLSPHDAGQIMVLQAITMAIVAPIAGRLSDRFEPRIIATSGCLIMACAFGLLDRINDTTPLYYIGACLLTLGFGFGLFTTPNNNAALSSVDKERLGIATALLNLSRVFGNMMGIAMVMILVSLIIGHAELKPQQFPALMTTIRWALALSCIYTVTGAYFSYTRGNIRIKPQPS